METSHSIIKFVIASDVGIRDGIGVEVYVGDEEVMEIFRDDRRKVRTVSIFKEEIPLDIFEQALNEFKSKIDWDFQE